MKSKFFIVNIIMNLHNQNVALLFNMIIYLSLVFTLLINSLYKNFKVNKMLL